MQIIQTIKTKNPVLYDAIANKSGIVFLEVSPVMLGADKCSSTATYYVVEENKKKILKITSPSFTKAEAMGLFQMSGIPVSNPFDEILALVKFATFYQVGASQIFGLTSNDWEAVVESSPSEPTA